MKALSGALLMLTSLTLQPAEAAFQSMPVKTMQVVIEDGIRRYEVTHPNYSFRVELLSDSEGLKSEEWQGGRPFVTAQPGERYAIRLYNPLPVRVAVNLTVDGLNSITGKPSSISEGTKWMIDPYSFIAIRGWQVNGEESRRFFFTDKPKSYARWNGDRLGKDLAANCGVIGAAYFWSQKELNDYYESHPQYRYTISWSLQGGGLCNRAVNGISTASAYPVAKAIDAAQAARQEMDKKAGAGMGERESNPTIQMAFDYNTGMYHPKDAVVIYYDFVRPALPDPFPAISYAPEMP